MGSCTSQLLNIQLFLPRHLAAFLSAWIGAYILARELSASKDSSTAFASPVLRAFFKLNQALGVKSTNLMKGVTI
ncbi:MAG: hypothetical protein H0U75_11405 [Legionella sp.]|nr:hypothetical protein [Legionella sp.]